MISIVVDLIKNKFLILEIDKRDILSSYRGTIIGVAWTLINSLIMLTIYTFLFSFVATKFITLDCNAIIVPRPIPWMANLILSLKAKSLYRNISVTNSPTPTVNTFSALDLDGGSVSLTNTFGGGFQFSNYKIWSASRNVFSNLK